MLNQSHTVAPFPLFFTYVYMSRLSM